MGRALWQIRMPVTRIIQSASWKLRSALRPSDRQAADMKSLWERGRLRREWRTLQVMVRVYCRGRGHAAAGGVCTDCREFLDYAEQRLEKCPYGPGKPTCARCPIHCYKPRPRALARDIMRYAGPRMLLRHPWLTVMHFLDQARRVEHPMVGRRRQRPPG
jgi:hypothetical protein